MTKHFQTEAAEKSLNISAVMETWTQQMGYPVISMMTNKNGGYKLVQERFLLHTDSTMKEKYTSPFE